MHVTFGSKEIPCRKAACAMKIFWGRNSNCIPVHREHFTHYYVLESMPEKWTAFRSPNAPSPPVINIMSSPLMLLRFIFLIIINPAPKFISNRSADSIYRLVLFFAICVNHHYFRIFQIWRYLEYDILSPLVFAAMWVQYAQGNKNHLSYGNTFEDHVRMYGHQLDLRYRPVFWAIFISWR